MKIEYLKDGNVVALASARRERKFTAIAQIEAYWHGVRNGRLMPTRSDIDPRGIGDNLTHAMILERIAPGHARIRLAGQQFSDLLDMEVRGMPISAFFTPDSRGELQETLENLFNMPAEVSMTLKGQAGALNKSIEAQLILLPLKDHEGRVTRVLGGLQTSGDVGRGPHRFSIQSLEVRPLTVDQGQTQKSNDAEQRQKEKMKRPGFWDIRGAAPVAPKNAPEERVKRVDVRPAAKSSDRKSEGHIMQPTGHNGTFVPGMAELAASFHGAPITPQPRPASRPGGHLRLVSQD